MVVYKNMQNKTTPYSLWLLLKIMCLNLLLPFPSVFFHAVAYLFFNAPNTHIIHINLNTIFYTHVEDSLSCMHSTAIHMLTITHKENTKIHQVQTSGCDKKLSATQPHKYVSLFV